MKLEPCIDHSRSKPGIGQGRRRSTAWPRQRGDAMIEALMGMLLCSALALGLGYAIARTLTQQRYAATQNSVLLQLGGWLQGTGLKTLCLGGTIPLVSVGNASVNLSAPSCTQSSVAVTAGAGTDGLNATIPANTVVTTMTLSTPSGNSAAKSMVGGDGVISITQ